MSITCGHLAASSVLTTKYRIAACELQFFIHHQLQNQKSHCYKWEKTACQMPCAIQMAEWLCYCQGKWESLAAKESGYWDDALDPRVTYIPRSGGPNRLSLLALISGKWEIPLCHTHSCDYYYFFHLFLQDVHQEWRSDLGLASLIPKLMEKCSPVGASSWESNRLAASKVMKQSEASLKPNSDKVFVAEIYRTWILHLFILVCIQIQHILFV